MNWQSVLVLSIVLVALLAVVIRGICNRKRGKSSCGCGCSACAMKEQCHK